MIDFPYEFVTIYFNETAPCTTQDTSVFTSSLCQSMTALVPNPFDMHRNVLVTHRLHCIHILYLSFRELHENC